MAMTASSGRGRIAIDGYNLALPQGTGVATYARTLSHALRRLGAEVGVLYGLNIPDRADPLQREVGFFDPPGEGRRRSTLNALRGAAEIGSAWIAGRSAVEIVLSGAVIDDEVRARLPSFDRLWNARRLFVLSQHYFNVTGRRLRVRLPAPPEVMHWTYPVPVELVGARNVYTLHDLVPLRLPFTTLDSKPRYLQLMRLLAREADHLVTVSEASRRDIMELLSVPAERVTNTHQSVEPAAPAEAGAVRALVSGALGLEPGGYHLFFGAIEPKKNVGRLLQAFLAADIDTPLVLVGKAAWKSEQELILLNGEGEEARPGARIVHLPYVPRPLLEALIRGARAVLFPSLYEGFGLPVLEALALGAPVVTSTTSSLPEVAGDAALLVDPYDVATLTAAIRRIDADAGLRARLAEAGPRQAARFSAEAYDARLRDLYRSLGVAL